MNETISRRWIFKVTNINTLDGVGIAFDVDATAGIDRNGNQWSNIVFGNNPAERSIPRMSVEDVIRFQRVMVEVEVWVRDQMKVLAAEQGKHDPKTSPHDSDS